MAKTQSKTAEDTGSQHYNAQQMDNSDKFSDVNFDEDGDIEHSASEEESESESIESIDHNVSHDSIENSDSVVIDGRFVRINTMTVDDIEGLDFGSEKEAYGFYVKYATCNGFVVRKDLVVRNVSGMIVTRRFLCNRAGERDQKHLARVDRKREHRAVTRINCEAHLRIHYNEERLRWVVTFFEVSHNHELTPSTHIHLFPAYRGMTDADKAQIDSLHSTGMQTCHIMGHMVANKGGYEAVGFTKKDLYNYFGKKTIVDIKDGDVVASLSYLRGKAGLDPMLYAKYTIGSNGKLKRLFWADGRSRNDFLWFGDVIAFDATYKKNKYKFERFKPVFHNYTIVEPRGLPNQNCGSNNCGVWVAAWIQECSVNDNYNFTQVCQDARMKLALDLVHSSYNQLMDEVEEKAHHHWKKTTKIA